MTDTTPQPASQPQSQQTGEPDAPHAATRPIVRPRGMVMRIIMTTVGRTGAKIGLVWVGLMVVLAVLAPVLASSHPLLWSVNGKVSSPWLMHLTPSDVIWFLGAILAIALVMIPCGPIHVRLVAWATTVAALVLVIIPSVWMDLAFVFVFTWASALGLLDGGLLLRLWYAFLGIALTIALFASAVTVLAFLGWSLWRYTKLASPLFLSVLALAVAQIVFSPISPPKVIVYSQYREAVAAGTVDWQVLAPIPYSPNDNQFDVLSATGNDPRLAPPSMTHLMGTTSQGADVLSRMIHACRIALTIGLIATGIALSIGIIIGALMGYFSGIVDLLGMRLVEIFSAIPVIFLLIMIVAFYGRSLYLMTVILGLTGWVGYALYVRAEFLKIRQMDYVAAAKACGLPLHSILLKHMLPNGVTPVLVLASFGIASMILTESTLSFLGLGLVEDPSWGQMLDEARSAGRQWGLVIFPGLAIFLTVFSYNLIGEALRDAVDPHAQGKVGE